VPQALIERLKHYFMTYKLSPDGQPVRIDQIYGGEHAQKVLEASMEDSQAKFGGSDQ